MRQRLLIQEVPYPIKTSRKAGEENWEEGIVTEIIRKILFAFI